MVNAAYIKGIICKALPVAAMLIMTTCGPGPTEGDEELDTPESIRREASRAPKDCGQLYANARRMDSILLNALEPSDTTGTRAISSFTSYAFYCANDSLSPVFLIKTAQVARTLGKHAHAKNALENCINTYRYFPDRPAAIFLLAQLYEDKTFMENRDEAERLYRQVIDEYPGSVWAENARGALTMIGKSDEEILHILNQVR